jgi:alanyl-tRNA synthetase
VQRGIRAGDLIREVAQIVGGSGGGRPTMAQAGGKDATSLPQALAAVPGLLEKALR